MSYYAHPIFGRVPTPPSPPTPPAHYHPTPVYGHGYEDDEFLGYRQSPFHRRHHHQPSPLPFHADVDLEAEERAALAHLRQIQQRREAEQASIRHEAAIRARVQQEREAAITAMVRAHSEREQAIAKARQEREAAIASAIQERQRNQAARERQVAAIQFAQRRQIEQQQAQRQYLAEAIQARQQQQRLVQAQKEQERQILAQIAEQKKEYVKRCATKCARGAAQSVAKEVKKEYKNEYEAVNNILGGLFGINLSEVIGEESKEVKKEVKEEVNSAPTSETKFPEDVNDLLSHFLGLRIEPATEGKSSAPASNEVPGGLNEFLSRYGLVFEPLDITKEAETSTSVPEVQVTTAESVSAADPPEPTLPTIAPAVTPAASTSKAAKVDDDHPLTTFLNGYADLPPFVRDILGNVEMAFKEEKRDQSKEEEVLGKGKGVAEGEKKERVVESPPTISEPIPVASTTTESEVPAKVEADKSLSTLSNISSELDLVRQSFDFPSTLSFATSNIDSTPTLLFNKTNSAYHAQTHKLLQLLLAADAVTSNGNKDVRRKRKQVVREVEQEIEGLEKKRDLVWQEVKVKRENGDEEVVSTSTDSSRASSVVDPTEIREDVPVEEEKDDKAASVTTEEVEAEKEVKDSNEGYELL